MTHRYALITGASAGFGKEFARQLASAGSNLVLVARRVEPMEILAAELREQHDVDVVITQADLSEPGAPIAIHDATTGKGIHVDTLINNAGSAGPDLLASRDWKRQQAHLTLMMTSVTLMCHLYIPAMQERGYGRVMNVASVAGQVTVAGDCNYGPTKTYLIALSKSLSDTVKRDGVNVMALCPGFTHTDFHQSKELAQMKAGMPDFLWYDVDVVVREGLDALERGRSVYTSGRLYRYLMPILRTPFSRMLIRAMGVNFRRPE
jgi:short-subunit dehydrogenase